MLSSGMRRTARRPRTCPLVIAGLGGQRGEHARQVRAHVPQPPTFRGEPQQSLHHGQSDQFSIRDPRGNPNPWPPGRNFGMGLQKIIWLTYRAVARVCRSLSIRAFQFEIGVITSILDTPPQHTDPQRTDHRSPPGINQLDLTTWREVAPRLFLLRERTVKTVLI